jgi:alpha-tubulin suppressor-like RCC1 family protein
VAAGFSHSCALLRTGAVRCWGSNSYGQLGDGTRTDRRTPTAVVMSTEVQAIATGTWHTCALTRTGAVHCWGRNEYGQLGDGSRTDRATPTTLTLCR